MRYRIFYYLATFSKKAVFSEKMAKTVSGRQVSFDEGKGVSSDENEYYFFMGNEVLNIFNLTVFSKIATFLEKMVKDNF